MSRVQQFTIKAPAPWINSNQRLHRMATAKLTALWRAAGLVRASHGDLEPWTEPVHIMAYIDKPRNGRYDPNNLWPTVKAIVDGLVEAGLLADDDHKHVIGPDMRHGGKGPAAVTLVIQPLPQNPA